MAAQFLLLGPARAEAAPVFRDADFYGINAERPHEDVYHSDLIGAGDESWSDYSVEAVVAIAETSVADGSAGLIFRWGGGEQDYYYFGVYPNEDKWKLLKPGSRALLEGSYPIDLEPASYNLKATVTQTSITVFIDGTAVGSSSDTTRLSGGAGLSVAGSDAKFSLIKINDLPQDASSWQARHAAAWSTASGGATVRGNVLLEPQLLASPELSPRLDAAFKMMKGMGARYVRMMLSWAEIQPQGSTQPYSWRYADAFAVAAHKYDLEIVPVLIFTPRWAVPEPYRGSAYYHAYPPVDSSGSFDTGGFSQFVAAAAGRYMKGGQLSAQMNWGAGGYGQAGHFEVGAEYNMGTIYEKHGSGWVAVNAGWLGSLAQYVDLLKAGHDAVKARCPACLVLNGAPTDDTIPNYFIGNDPARYDGYVPYLDSSRLYNPDGTAAWRQTVWQGVDDLYDEIERRPAPDNDPGKYFDILNIHTFMWKGFTAEWPATVDRYVNCSFYSGDCWRQWYRKRLAEVARVMNEHNDPRDIWLSETGFASSRAANDFVDFLGNLTDEGQAQALETAYSESAGVPQVKKVFWWQGYDSRYSGNLGLIRSGDMSAKPAYEKYGWMTGQLAGGIAYEPSGQAYWKSYGDYLARSLSVDFIATNRTPVSHNLDVTRVVSSNRVEKRTALPLAVGSVPVASGGSQKFTIEYYVPPGVSSFKTRITLLPW